MRSGPTFALGAAMAAPITLMLVSASAQQGVPVDLPPPWEISFSLHDQAKSTRNGAVILRTTDFAGMKYSVRALPALTVDPARPLLGEFKQITDAKAPKSHADQVLTGPSSSRKTLPQPPWKTERELLLGRRVEIKNCDKVLDVQTPGSRNMPSHGTPNAFVISANLQWSPTHWKATTYIPGPPKTVTVPPMPEGGPILTLPELEVPYNFELLTNDNGGTAYTLPSYSFGGFRTVKRTIRYTITRKPMWVEYRDPRTSLIGQLPSCDVCRDQYGNPNYARGVETGIHQEDGPNFRSGDRWTADLRFIHGNVDLHLMIDGKDVTGFKSIEGGTSTTFELLRLRRDWQWPLDRDGNLIPGPGGRPIGGIKPPTDPDTRRYRNGWFDDDATPGNFKDMPGSFQDRPPVNWESERETKEFLVAVKGFPEFGFYYYSMTFETRPGQLRFSQSPDATQLKSGEWCGRMMNPASAPFEQPNFGSWVTRFAD